ncbi:hypothetical protein SAMN04488082_11670 [Desulfomicrobium apsheronum]|uniref:Uncharacterized protein n=1 Tax=Desulfomicrobium apsheronum TaxID=52560 RepID=A0A1I3XHE0_9BACT|nr:hypothetical protein [Desulfomicrobium apsheronum]SFK18759.1 hypothetical protein SAMN04488082_11670 [Desulfomicrobium apsheronum]
MRSIDPMNPAAWDPAITEQDHAVFERVISTDLSDEKLKELASPPLTLPVQQSVMAVHWHPEFVPMPVIEQRVHNMFPAMTESLIIPTQHNEILEYGDFSGVEVDCYSHGFNQKVQLLLHFATARLDHAHTLRAMLRHTLTYRASQLFDFMHTITAPLEDRIEQAARETGADLDLVEFVRHHVTKVQRMVEDNHARLPQDALKNKLLRNYFDALRPVYDSELIDRIQTYLSAVKAIVKTHFSLRYFYRTSEVIEEVRALGGGIIIPHPEQFWPILLADYDVDGYEVWNPQSQRYTDFLITVVGRVNACEGLSQRRKLVFMGDDTHMGEKVKDVSQRNSEKANREIGYQPAWDDLELSKRLILSGMSREIVIREYRERLLG